MVLKTYNIKLILQYIVYAKFIVAAIPTTPIVPVTELPNSTETVKNKSVCWVQNVAYNNREIVQGAGPCEECVCNAPNIVCSIIKCEVKAGCKIIQRQNQCCPSYECECEHNGRIYNNGERIDNPEMPCRVCYCKGGEVMCTSVSCYERNDCEGKIVPGMCCPKYDHCPPIDTTSKQPIHTTLEAAVILRTRKHISQSMITDTINTTNSFNGSPTFESDIKSNGSTLLPRNTMTVIIKDHLVNTNANIDRTNVTTKSESPIIDIKEPTSSDVTTARLQYVKITRIPVTSIPFRCHHAKNNTATSNPTTLPFNQAANHTFMDVEKSTIDIVQQLLDSKTTIEPITITEVATTTLPKIENSEDVEKVVVHTTILVAENGTNEEIARVQQVKESSFVNWTKDPISKIIDGFTESAEVDPLHKITNVSKQLETVETISVHIKLGNESNVAITDKGENTTADRKNQTLLEQNTESFQNDKHRQSLLTSSNIEEEYMEVANIELFHKNVFELNDSWENIGQVSTNVRVANFKNESNSGIGSQSKENKLAEYKTNSTSFQEIKSSELDNHTFTREFKNTSRPITSVISTSLEKDKAEEHDSGLTLQLAITTEKSEISNISKIFQMNVISVSLTPDPIIMSSKRLNSQQNHTNLEVNNTRLDTSDHIRPEFEVYNSFESHFTRPVSQLMSQIQNYSSHKSQSSVTESSTYLISDHKQTTFIKKNITPYSSVIPATNTILYSAIKEQEPEMFALFVRNSPFFDRQSTQIKDEDFRENTSTTEPNSTSPGHVKEYRTKFTTEVGERTTKSGTLIVENGITVETASPTPEKSSTYVAPISSTGISNSTEFVQSLVNISHSTTQSGNYDSSFMHDMSNDNCTTDLSLSSSVPETNLVNSSMTLSSSATVISFPQLPFKESNFTEIYAQKFIMHPIKFINTVNSMYMSPGIGYSEVSPKSPHMQPLSDASIVNATSMPVLLSSVQNNSVPESTSILESIVSNLTIEANSTMGSIVNASSITQDTKTIDSPLQNISLSNYKILLDSLVESKVKPATQMPNVTMIPLTWLKSSVSSVVPNAMEVTTSPSQMNKIDLQKNNAYFPYSQSTRNSTNITIPLELSKNESLKNEFREEPPQAKVYDPLMPYPKEYPKEYQTIQNGPTLVITRTTYTRIPKITYTTIMTTTFPKYIQMQKAEEIFSETLFYRKLHEQSFKKQNSSNKAPTSISEMNSKYFDINVTKIEENENHDEEISDRKRPYVQRTKNQNTIIGKTPREEGSRKDEHTLNVPSLDEKDLKIVQNFMSKNLQILR